MTAKSKEEVVQEFRIQSIQEATMRVIARKGMSAATMQEIAEEAGVAKGTLYLYFRDRDELVEKTFENAMTQLHARVDEALHSNAPIEERLRSVIAAKFRFFEENREFFRLYMSLRIPEGNPSQQRRQKRTCQPQYKARIDQLADVLREAMERGEVRQMDPRRLALLLIEGSNAIVIERIMEEPAPLAADDVELIVSALFDGIAARKPERSTN